MTTKLKTICMKILGWVLAIGEPRQYSLRSSITGEPLLMYQEGHMGGYSIETSDVGMQGAHVAITISQLGDNREAAIKVLRGEYDYCLSYTGKESLIDTIIDRMEVGGYYLTTQRNEQGTLDIIRVYWDEDTYTTVKQLIEER